MKDRDSYIGVDGFRGVAALLIIMIRTSPLASYSETGDFLLTRAAARIAVPFFFMTSGFFLISRFSCNADKLVRFLKRMLWLYGAAIVLYIPINLYQGYFKRENLLLKLLQDFVFNGTLYHLWYLPASMLGAAIAWYLVKKLDYQGAFGVTAALYLAGLLGDSYYGLSEKISGIRAFYQLLFQGMDKTRNGFFFAPVFFVMGGYLSDRCREEAVKSRSVCAAGGGNGKKVHMSGEKNERRKAGCFIGFAILFCLMLTEAYVLHALDWQRHDSMYLCLPFCMYFLFSFLLFYRGKSLAGLRTATMLVYLVHPMMIVAVRFLAKLFSRQERWVENSLIHFLLVSALSIAFGSTVSMGYRRITDAKRRGKSAAMVSTEEKGIPTEKFRREAYLAAGERYDCRKARAWLEINLRNLEHNVLELQKLLPSDCELMAVVKTEAYGHGAFAISAHLNRMGVRAFAVAVIEEGIRLRKSGIRGEILILGYTEPRRAKELKKYNLTQSILDFSYAKALNQMGVTVKTHIKIDTGMHRMGIADSDREAIKRIFAMKNLKVCGIYTHLCCADSREPEEMAYTNGQRERFFEVADFLRKEGIAVSKLKLHWQSSYGLLNYPEDSADRKSDYVRAGIALYGVLSSPSDKTGCRPDLRPVLSVKSRVVLIRNIKTGESVGYGRQFTAERESRIAILPIGYGDGFPRNLSCGKAKVRIGPYLCSVAGRISMDSLAVDITDAKEVALGDIATLIDAETECALSAPVVADNSESISNELLCRMSARLPVVTVE